MLSLIGLVSVEAALAIQIIHRRGIFMFLSLFAAAKSFFADFTTAFPRAEWRNSGVKDLFQTENSPQNLVTKVKLSHY